jgi:hypothetical protein
MLFIINVPVETGGEVTFSRCWMTAAYQNKKEELNMVRSLMFIAALFCSFMVWSNAYAQDRDRTKDQDKTVLHDRDVLKDQDRLQIRDRDKTGDKDMTRDRVKDHLNTGSGGKSSGSGMGAGSRGGGRR